MGDTWITDMTHFLDQWGQPAEFRGSRIAKHLGAIVSYLTSSPSDTMCELPLSCRRRPNRKACPGKIHAGFEPGTDNIIWSCPVCDDRGLIHHWQNTFWDKGGRAGLPQVRKITYQHGFMDSIQGEADLDETILVGGDVSHDIIRAIHDNQILGASGVYGDNGSHDRESKSKKGILMEQVPPQLRIWQLVLGFANSRVLYELVKTGVIEQLRDQPKRLPELAQACRLNPDMLYRTLRYAGVIGVVDREDEQYFLTDVGRLLLKDVPGSLYGGVMLAGSEPWQRAWSNFGHALATGENAFGPATGASFFEYLERHPEFGEPFNRWMTTMTTLAAPAIAEAYDFRPFGTVCDIGGGQGILLKAILEANPHLRGILYDNERVVQNHVLADLDPRVEVQTGSFFERVPAADVLLLKNVLHDWPDEKCEIILNRCRQAMRPSSRLLIIDRLIGSPTDLPSVFYDLHMQVIQGGRERTEQEFSSLLQKAGMKLNRIISTRSPMKIVETSL